MQYISARLAPGVTAKVLAETGKKKISKAALKALPMTWWFGAPAPAPAPRPRPGTVGAMLEGRPAPAPQPIHPIEFISTSMFHRPGSWFTVNELADVNGTPVTIELRDDAQQLVAMIALTSTEQDTVEVRIS